MVTLKQAWSLRLLQSVGFTLAILASSSQAQSQSLAYVEGVALQLSYTPPSLPFTVKAVYGDFRNQNPIWVQVWKTTNESFSFTLEWQTKITPVNGDGQGEWFELQEEYQTTLDEGDKLGLVNAAIPGPLMQSGNLRAEIVLSTTNVRGSDGDIMLEVGQELTYDDLVFPYQIPLYFCNTSDCIYVRYSLGRAELPIQTSSTIAVSITERLTTTAPTPQAVREVRESVPLAVWIWLAVLSLVLLLSLILILGIFAYASRRTHVRSADAYRYANKEAPTNAAYSSLSSVSTNYNPSPKLTTASSPNQIDTKSELESNSYYAMGHRGQLNKAFHNQSFLTRAPKDINERKQNRPERREARNATLFLNNPCKRSTPFSKQSGAAKHNISNASELPAARYGYQMPRLSIQTRDLKRTRDLIKSRDQIVNPERGSSSSAGMVECEDSDSFESMSSTYHCSKPYARF